jgi:hypothetical protein
MGSARVANVRRLVFNASCHKSMPSHPWWIPVTRLWLFAEKLKARIGSSQQYSPRVAAAGKISVITVTSQDLVLNTDLVTNPNSGANPNPDPVNVLKMI